MGAKPKDITNKRYGKLVAKYRTDQKDGKCYIWHCECDCGNSIDVAINHLEHGDIKSCGCLIHDYNDITNKVYGRLTVISYAGNKDGISLWNCKCQCGNTCIVPYQKLVSGNTKSCGCLKTEHMKKLYVANTNVSKLLNKKLRATNTSGVTGVCWNKEKSKWDAEIIFRGVRYKLGRYENKEDAIKVRKTAEEKLHGDFLKWYEEEYKKNTAEQVYK